MCYLAGVLGCRFYRLPCLHGIIKRGVGVLEQSRLHGGVVDATEETVPEQLIYLFPEITSTR